MFWEPQTQSPLHWGLGGWIPASWDVNRSLTLDKSQDCFFLPFPSAISYHISPPRTVMSYPPPPPPPPKQFLTNFVPPLPLPCGGAQAGTRTKKLSLTPCPFAACTRLASLVSTASVRGWGRRRGEGRRRQTSFCQRLKNKYPLCLTNCTSPPPPHPTPSHLKHRHLDC